MKENELRNIISLSTKIFPDFFGQGYVIYKIKSEKIEELMQQIREKKYQVPDISQALQACEYMKNIIQIREQLTDKEILSILSVYDSLIYEISEYQFNAIDNKSIGYRQTIANRSILLDIALLRESLLRMLANIQSYLANIDNNFTGTQIRIIRDLLRLADGLIDATDDIRNAKIEYWNIFNHQRKGTYHELGEARKNWRDEKNQGLHKILEFYDKLVGIDSVIPIDNKKYGLLDYREIRNYIQTGPYAYSYLTASERHYQTAHNKAKKKSGKH